MIEKLTELATEINQLKTRAGLTAMARLIEQFKDKNPELIANNNLAIDDGDLFVILETGEGRLQTPTAEWMYPSGEILRDVFAYR
ncbi:MAG: hypothetical protein LBQ05_00575, partial [Christensenellaceae bacterium]|nr:hypothetical protein [Christensenellaceae bacterium]